MSHERPTRAHKVWRMRTNKRLSLCVDSVLWYLWLAVHLYYIECFHVASCCRKQCIVEQSALLFPPGDDVRVKWLTFFRIGPRLLSTHSFSWYTYSCSLSHSGFNSNAVNHRLISVIIFPPYLHVDIQGIDWRTEVQPTWACGFDRQKPAENSWEFHCRVGFKISDISQIQPTEAMRSRYKFLDTRMGRMPRQTADKLPGFSVYHATKSRSEKVDFLVV